MPSLKQPASQDASYSSSCVSSVASFSARYGVETLWAGSRRGAEILAISLMIKWSKHLEPAEPKPFRKRIPDELLPASERAGGSQ